LVSLNIYLKIDQQNRNSSNKNDSSNFSCNKCCGLVSVSLANFGGQPSKLDIRAMHQQEKKIIFSKNE
jgi:hypothetical protein